VTVGDLGTVIQRGDVQPSITESALRGVWGEGNTYYAVGSSGTIVRWDFGAWSPMASGTASALWGVWGSLHYQDVYAVGDSGTILHCCSGPGNWDRMASGTTASLRGIWGTSEITYVVGEGGTLLRGYRGATVIVTPNAPTLTALGARRQLAGEVRASEGAAITGVPLTWSSSDSAVATVDGSGLVTAVANGNATITGTAPGGASGSTVVTVHQVARTVRFEPPGVTLNLEANPTFEVTVLAEDSLGHTMDASSAGFRSLNPAVAVAGGGVVTAVGAGQATIETTMPGGATAYFVATVIVPGATPVNLWRRMPSGVTDYVRGVWGTSERDVIAVGDFGTALHFDGSDWTPMAGETGRNWSAVWGASANDVFAVGSDGQVHTTLMHFDGATWTQTLSPSSGFLNGVWGASGRDVFAVGTGGQIFHFDGSGWTPMSSGTGTQLRAVWGTSTRDVFAVGHGGTILHYDGSTWSAMASGTTGDLLGVWGAALGDVFAAGESDVIVRFDGSNWSPMSGTGFPGSRALWGASRNDLYGAGVGSLLRFNGTIWTANGDGTSAGVLGLWGTSAHEVYAVGTGGTILQGFRGASVELTPVGPTLTTPGATVQPMVTARDAAGRLVVGVVSYSWTSSDSAVATVDASTGMVTAVSRGVATITATASGGASGSVQVRADLPVAPQPPTALGQYWSNGATALAVGQPTAETAVVLKGTATDSNATDTLTLEVEVRPLGSTFADQPTQASPIFLNGGTGSATIGGLPRSTGYHWQARACDQTSRCGAWVAFGGNVESDADFQVASSAIDNTPPVVTGVTVDKMAVDVRAGADSVVFTVAATDDLSGVGSIYIGVTSPSGTQTAGCSERRVSGTAINGTYSCTAQWPQFREVGAWRWSNLYISDVAGNGRSYDSTAAAANGWPTVITVQSVVDVAAPVVTGVTVDKMAVDVRAGADSVVFTVAATDDLSGVGSIYIGVTSPSGTQTAGCSGQRVSGTAINGTYSCMAQWPQFREVGIWRLSNLYILDVAGNGRSYDSTAAAANGWPTEITVQGPTGAPPLTASAPALRPDPSTPLPARRP
jgi:uncharacterized protein YjdB